MTVITISREYGSGGAMIGARVAQELGYRYVDKKVMERVLQQYGFVQFDEVYRSTPGFWSRLDDTTVLMISMLNQVIQAMAQHGDMVLVGRGGFTVLQEYADVLNVRIQAPFDLRVRRVMAREDIASVQAGEDLVKANDKARTAFLRTYYGIEPNDASRFDLVLDTGVIAADLAVSWIAAAARALGQRETKIGMTGTIDVDPILAMTVAEVFRREDQPGS